MAAGIKGDCAERMNGNAKIRRFSSNLVIREKKKRKKREERGGVDWFYAYNKQLAVFTLAR